LFFASHGDLYYKEKIGWWFSSLSLPRKNLMPKLK
jgi:hypothetical protein